jgi:hypothetical protein
MNDHLSHLVARSLNLATVVQPRQVSLFEPPQQMGGLMFGQDVGPEMVDATSASDEAEIRPAPIPPSVRPSAEPPPERQPLMTGSQVAPSMPAPLPGNMITPSGPPPRPSTDPSWAVPVTSQPVQAGLDHPLDQPAPSPPQSATSQTSVPISPPDLSDQSPRRPSQQPDADPPKQLPAVDKSEAEAPSSRSAARPQRPAHESVDARVVSEPVASPGQLLMHSRDITLTPQKVNPQMTRVNAEEPSPPVTSQLEPSPMQSVRPVASMPVIAKPQVTPRIELAAPAAVQPPTARELTPTIRVTIGRIEVRAIMPPSPPAPSSTSARPAPALSLDAYLKQRSGGKL